MDVPIELRQLRYFVAVAEELHFGRAAARLAGNKWEVYTVLEDVESGATVASSHEGACCDPAGACC